MDHLNKEKLKMEIPNIKEKSSAFSNSSSFVKKNMWTLDGKFIESFVFKKVYFDFINKKINLEAYESISSDGKDIEVHKWVEDNLKKEVLKFATYNNHGNKIYEYEINGLDVVSSSSDFNHDDSDPSTLKLTLSYECLKRSISICDHHHHHNNKFIWTAGLAGDNVEFEIEISCKRLHKKHLSISFIKPSGIDVKLIDMLFSNSKPTIILNKYDNPGNQAIESKTLKNCELVSFVYENCKNHDKKYNIIISHS